MRTLPPLVLAVLCGSESKNPGVIGALSPVTFPIFNGGNTGSNPVRVASRLKAVIINDLRIYFWTDLGLLLTGLLICPRKSTVAWRMPLSDSSLLVDNAALQ